MERPLRVMNRRWHVRVRMAGLLATVDVFVTDARSQLRATTGGQRRVRIETLFRLPGGLAQ